MVGLSGLGLVIAGLLAWLLVGGGNDPAGDPRGALDRAVAPVPAPSTVLPASTTTTTWVPVTTTLVGPASTTPPLTVNTPINVPPLPPSPDPYYGSCAEARAAGVAPLYLGEPGYRPGLDSDKDGVACE